MRHGVRHMNDMDQGERISVFRRVMTRDRVHDRCWKAPMTGERHTGLHMIDTKHGTLDAQYIRILRGPSLQHLFIVDGAPGHQDQTAEVVQKPGCKSNVFVQGQCAGQWTRAERGADAMPPEPFEIE